MRECYCVVDRAVGRIHKIVMRLDKDGCTLECEVSKLCEMMRVDMCD